MQTLEEYIAKRKHKDHMDEFNLAKHSENMSTAIQYVMDYFNSYLDIEQISQEQIKLERAIDKFKERLGVYYPEQLETIVDFYIKHRKRLDSIVEDAYDNKKYSSLFYSQEEDHDLAVEICANDLRKEEITPELPQIIESMVHQHRIDVVSPPTVSQMIDVDETLVKWVKETFSEYHVNLLDFAGEISEDYYKRYIEYRHSRYNDHVYTYRLVNYEYRYRNNPFSIDRIYEENEHRPFISGRKGALEMLIMHDWLFNWANDEEYWPEYVLLCERAGKIQLTSKKRTLIPVKTNHAIYPVGIIAPYQYVETISGKISDEIDGKYILRITYKKGDDTIWTDPEKMEALISNLRSSFETHGLPALLEIDSPYKGASLTEEEFISQYIRFEKATVKRTGMKIALVNGSTRTVKGKTSMYATVEDLIRLNTLCKERRLKLNLAINFSDNRRRNDIGENLSGSVDILAALRKFIIAIHLNALSGWSGYHKTYSKDIDEDSRYIYIDNRVKPLSEFLACFATLIQDGRPRYFIPDSVGSSASLEELVDYLFRAGIDFESEELHED